MQRYFVKEKNNQNFILYEQDIHHIKNVMRNKIGDNIEIVSDDKIYLCELTNITPLELKIVDEYSENRGLEVELTIAVSLVQEQKFDLILQKLTELGVTTIIPIKTERSIVRLDDKKIDKKLQRWHTICKEASEQSHRTNIPKIASIMTIKELTNIENDICMLCSLNETTKSLDYYLNDNIKKILFVIGPEGGFTKEEEKYLLSNNFKSVTLGKRVLRVETAAIYVASIINYIYKG